MTKPRISFDWSYRGFRTCILENELLRVTVVPEIEAKVHEMVYKPADRDLLYHYPRVELRRPVYRFGSSAGWSFDPVSRSCESSTPSPISGAALRLHLGHSSGAFIPGFRWSRQHESRSLRVADTCTSRGRTTALAHGTGHTTGPSQRSWSRAEMRPGRRTSTSPPSSRPGGSPYGTPSGGVASA